MKSTSLLSLAAVGLLTVSAAGSAMAKSPEEPAKPARQQCFWTRDVDSFASRDDKIVNVRVGVNNYYQFELMGPCLDVNWNERIVLKSRGSDRICSGIDAEIISPTNIGPQRCPVTHIRKLTPAEVAALPRGTRP